MKEYRGIFLSEPQEPEPDGAGRIICLYFISPTAVVEINHFPAAVIGVGKEGADFFFRLVPSILDPRRIVALGDRAAGNPDWWRANRLKFFCPEMTYRDIAAALRLLPHQVRDYCRNVELTTDVYDHLPKL